LTRSRTRVQNDLADDAVDVDAGPSKRCLAGFETVEIEHLADQRVDLLSRAENFVGAGLDLVRGKASVADQLAETLDADKGGAGCVPHHRRKLRAHLVG